MGQLIQAQKVIVKDGELIVHLTIDLNINLGSIGDLVPNLVKPELKTEFVVPTFESAEKIKFGK